MRKMHLGGGAGQSVCHFPPGTSKWNKIEHRLLSGDGARPGGTSPRTHLPMPLPASGSEI